MSLKVFAVVPLFLLAPLCARAEGPTLRLNNPGTVISVPTEVSVDLLMPNDPDQQAVAALIVVEYDPAVVALSSPQAVDPLLWNDFSPYAIADHHQLRILMLTDSFKPGQTTTGPLLKFTVTPVGASADLSVCATLRLVGGAYGQDYTSNLAIYRPSLLDWDSLWVPSSCGPLGPIYTPPVEEGVIATDGTGTTDSMDEEGEEDPENSGISVTIESVKRILRYAAGLASEPNRWSLSYPQNDANTMELTDTNFTMIASPPNACNITTARHLTMEDAILFLKIAFSYQSQAVWSMDFLGNPMLGGNAANATSMPAIADIDGDGKMDAAFTMGIIAGTQFTDPDNNGNPGKVYILTDQLGNGAYALKSGGGNWPGWPQPMRDAPAGIALADLVPATYGSTDKRLEVIASNFQDVFDINGNYIGDLYSRFYVWDHLGRGVSPFAHSDNPDSPNPAFPNDPTKAIGLALGHTNTASVVWDVDKNGRPEVFLPAMGHYDRDLYSGTYGGSIQRVEATSQPDGAVTVTTRAIREGNLDGKWLTEPDTPKMPGIPASSNHAAFQAPPVMVRTDLNDPDSDRIVVAGAEAGDVYGWDKDGNRVFYFQTDGIVQMTELGEKDRGRAPVMNPLAAADVTGDGYSDVVVATGNYLNYSERDCAPDPPEVARYWDGYIYCFGRDTQGAWSRKWRYPASNVTDEYGRPGGYPAFASGVAVGRLRGPDLPPCVVAVDMSGRVLA